MFLKTGENETHFHLVFADSSPPVSTQVLNRTLHFDDESRCYYFAPKGVAPTKTERARRAQVGPGCPNEKIS